MQHSERRSITKKNLLCVTLRYVTKNHTMTPLLSLPSNGWVWLDVRSSSEELLGRLSGGRFGHHSTSPVSIDSSEEFSAKLHVPPVSFAASAVCRVSFGACDLVSLAVSASGSLTIWIGCCSVIVSCSRMLVESPTGSVLFAFSGGKLPPRSQLGWY